MYCEVRYLKSLNQCINKNSISKMTANIPKLTACLCGMVPFSDNAVDTIQKPSSYGYTVPNDTCTLRESCKRMNK